MENFNADDLIEIATDAIEHIDDDVAFSTLKKLGDYINKRNLQQNDQDLFNQLTDLVSKLYIVAFPKFSDDDCVEILKNHYLDSYAIGVSMESRITIKLFSVPEIPRDELRKKFKQALMENNQLLGPLTVSQWIAEFEKDFDVRNRTLSASTEFVKNNKNTLTLNPILRNNLKTLLYTYDYLLVTTLPATGPVLEEILSSDFGDISATTSRSGISAQRFAPENMKETKIENLPIDIAMEKYPELGEQLITSNHIKLRIFPEPVRPSIKNWLSDYTFTVGISNHDPIVRGNYIFKGENARLLSQEDRARLTAILKSFEEKMPLAVNVNTRQIVFSLPEKRVLPQAQNNFPPTETRRMPENYAQPRRIQESQPRFQTDEERISAWRRNLPQKEELENKPVASNVHFSSPQTFSTEKSPETVRPIQPNYPQKAPIAKINYVAPRPMPKNVVDLREENSM
jgi:hypothetical protein